MIIENKKRLTPYAGLEPATSTFMLIIGGHGCIGLLSLFLSFNVAWKNFRGQNTFNWEGKHPDFFTITLLVTFMKMFFNNSN